MESDWCVDGTADNGGEPGNGYSFGDAQMNANFDSEPDDDADNSEAGHWAGEKEEGSPFNSISLVLSFPPGLVLTWDDDDGKTWEDENGDPQTETWTGHINNVRDDDEYDDEFFIDIRLKTRAHGRAENNAGDGSAVTDINVPQFDFE